MDLYSFPGQNVLLSPQREYCEAVYSRYVYLLTQHRMKLLYMKVPCWFLLASQATRTDPSPERLTQKGNFPTLPCNRIDLRVSTDRCSVFGGTSQPSMEYYVPFAYLKMIYLTHQLPQVLTYIWHSGARHLAHIHFTVDPHNTNK